MKVFLLMVFGFFGANVYWTHVLLCCCVSSRRGNCKLAVPGTVVSSLVRIPILTHLQTYRRCKELITTQQHQESSLSGSFHVSEIFLSAAPSRPLFRASMIASSPRRFANSKALSPSSFFIVGSAPNSTSSFTISGGPSLTYQPSDSASPSGPGEDVGAPALSKRRTTAG